MKNTDGKPQKTPQPRDFITISVRKGYLPWLRMVADELNLDLSKLTRIAIEEWVKANRTQLSDQVLKEFEKVKHGHVYKQE